MRPKKYAKHPALNYSLIADFNDCPARALMKKGPQSYFEKGIQAELILEDNTTGTSHFDARYAVGELPATLPQKFIEMVECGGDPNDYYVYTKTGAPNKTYAGLHAYLDAYKENGNRIPISWEQYTELQTMAFNLLQTTFKGQKLEDILQAGAQWQVPIYWRKNEIEKKALIDVTSEHFLYEGLPYRLIIDIKTSASIPQFLKMARMRYCIQDVHYLEGAEANFDSVFPMMVFAVVSTTPPYKAQCFTVDPQDRELLVEDYAQLCQDVEDWIAADRPSKAWSEDAVINLYRNKD